MGRLTGKSRYELCGGSQRLLDIFDAARDGLLESMQRWDNRLSLQRPVSEQYIHDGLTLVCDLEFSGRRYRIQFSAAIHLHGEVFDVQARSDTIYICDGRNRDDGQDDMVLVGDVQLVEGGEGIVAPLVGLYRVGEDVDDGLARRLYVSVCTKGAYKVIPVLPKRKLRPVVRSISDTSDQLIVHEVQRRAEIVDGVANDAGCLFGYRVGLKAKDMAARIGVTFYPHSVKVGLEEGVEGPLKLVDVLLGPLDLEPSSLEGAIPTRDVSER